MSNFELGEGPLRDFFATAVPDVVELADINQKSVIISL